MRQFTGIHSQVGSTEVLNNKMRDKLELGAF
jgi:hypothetical protein